MASASSSNTVFGILARFETPGELVAGSRRVRQEGYAKWDAHCPFPVHGLETAMGLERSWVPWFSFLFAM
ncbi:MAG: DUF3341 domain-containing protein, partial [Acidobacteriota bacterium]|nr:DUF3341 domain-containing protein [Acidobacteriota bacterium]